MEIATRHEASILVVDDDINELRALLIGLQLEGFEVRGVSSGEEALETLSERHYDLALLDLMMPEMNGLKLARSIRSAHPDTTAVLMSAYHLSPVQLARADTGAVGFVPKPFRFDELVGFIRTKLGQRSLVEADSRRADERYSKDGLHSPFDVPKIA
jgi:DNA-binding NtrC family response regulator